jgi:protein-disulfide isomerase
MTVRTLVLSLLSLGVLFFSGSPPEAKAQEVSTPQSPQTKQSSECPTQDNAVPDSLDAYSGALQLGSDNAPVRLIEFFDPNCPYCKSFHKRLLPALAERIPMDSVSIYMHPYPIKKASIPQFNALYFAQESEDQYQELLDVMFSFGAPNSMGPDILKYYAQAANLPPNPLTRAALTGDYKSSIQGSIELAKTLGIEGTPTLFIGDSKIGRDSYSPECFAQIIESRMGSGPES